LDCCRRCRLHPHNNWSNRWNVSKLTLSANWISNKAFIVFIEVLKTHTLCSWMVRLSLMNLIWRRIKLFFHTSEEGWMELESLYIIREWPMKVRKPCCVQNRQSFLLIWCDKYTFFYIGICPVWLKQLKTFILKDT
jgi:hypothetical protein